VGREQLPLIPSPHGHATDPRPATEKSGLPPLRSGFIHIYFPLFRMDTLDLGLALVQAVAAGVPLTTCCIAPLDPAEPEFAVCTVCGKHFCRVVSPSLS
jgi:hypothetical protein